MSEQPKTIEQELLLGGAGAAEARELAELARSLPKMRQLPLLQTPPSLQMGHRAARRRRLVRRLPLAGVFTAAMASVALVTAAVMAVAQLAVPGDALYGVKRAGEAVAVRMQPGFHDEMMMRRADEVSTLVERGGSSQVISATLASYNQAVAHDPAGSYAARDYCAGMLKTAAAHADPEMRTQIMQSLSHLKLDNT